MVARRYTDFINRLDFVKRNRSGLFSTELLFLLVLCGLIFHLFEGLYSITTLVRFCIDVFLLFVLCYIFFGHCNRSSLMSRTEYQNALISGALKVFTESFIITDPAGIVVHHFNLPKDLQSISGSNLFDVLPRSDVEELKKALIEMRPSQIRLLSHKAIFWVWPLPRPEGASIAFTASNLMTCLQYDLFDSHDLGYYLRSSSGFILDANRTFLGFAGLQSISDALRVEQVLSNMRRMHQDLFYGLSITERTVFNGLEEQFQALVSRVSVKLHQVLEEVLIPVCQTDCNGLIIDCNAAFSARFKLKDRAGDTLDNLLSCKFIFENGVIEEVSTNAGEHFRVYVSAKNECFLLFWVDIGDKKSLEVDLLHSQKVGSLGRFAGGIAHDFNNILTVILSFCDLLSDCHAPGDQSYPYIVQIKQNVRRASTLVQQILAFSRKQIFTLRVFDMNELVADLFDMINRIIGEGVHLDIRYGHNLWNIMADKGQMEQVLTNLVVNAKAAMKASGGILTIVTENSVLGGDVVQLDVHNNKIGEGSYVKLAVRDTGCGIPPAIREKIFDPFFTTKSDGNGLGLSTVHGIVAQSGGYVSLTTVEGKGTEFIIWMPRAIAASDVNVTPFVEESSNVVEIQMAGPGNKGRVLIIEDEATIASIITKTLQGKGYEVLSANSGEEARMLITSGSEIDVIVSDIILPDGSGVEVVSFAKTIYSKIKVIYMSGYSRQELDRTIEYSYQFLAKPFSMKDLVALLQKE